MLGACWSDQRFNRRSVRLGHEDMRNGIQEFGESVGYLPQDVQLFPLRSGKIGRMRGMLRDKDVFDAAET